MRKTTKRLERAEVIAEAIENLERWVEHYAAIPGSLAARRMSRQIAEFVPIVQSYAERSFASSDRIAPGALIAMDDGNVYLVHGELPHAVSISLTGPSCRSFPFRALQRQGVQRVGDTYEWTVGRPGDSLEQRTLSMQVTDLW